MADVNIKIADQGWILESLAHDISDASNDVSVSTSTNCVSPIQYYMNYSSWNGRQSEIEVAFFTHIEQDPLTRLHFFRVAENVDHCVCMAQRYADELSEYGIKNVSVISPGIDLDHFSPNIKIGVVGRAYDTGRKGEDLVRQVMDVKGIDWLFTAEGWPGPALNLPYDRMPEFYNSVDYILVPSLYEGGPMCVVEGLACGKEIIASDVGWVNDFPHIHFERGNSVSLRKVLNELVAKRHSLRQAVTGYSKYNWALAHLQLFEDLLGKNLSRRTGHDYELAIKSRAKPKKTFGAELILHGKEGVVGGGPSTRVPNTVEKMKNMGLPASLGWEKSGEASLTHIFNLFSFDTCLQSIGIARRKGNDVLLSPIFLNLNDAQIFSILVPKLFEGLEGKELDQTLSEVFCHIENNENLPLLEPYENYHKNVCDLINRADGVILLSDYERRCLDTIGALKNTPSHIVRNPTEIGGFASGGQELVTDLIGTERYFLQIGRIEPRKNQLLLAECARRLGIKVVFIGDCAHTEYADLVRRVAGACGVFLGRIGHDNPLFGALIDHAAAVCLPSWSEGAPIAALEAGSRGANMILSTRSAEKEYFGEHATYVNPVDINGLMSSLEMALNTMDNGKNEPLIDLVKTQFSYERHVGDTLEAYNRLAPSIAPLGLTG